MNTESGRTGAVQVIPYRCSQADSSQRCLQISLLFHTLCKITHRSDCSAYETQFIRALSCLLTGPHSHPQLPSQRLHLSRDSRAVHAFSIFARRHRSAPHRSYITNTHAIALCTLSGCSSEITVSSRIALIVPPNITCWKFSGT